MKGHCHDLARVSMQDAETGSLANIPQANRLVIPTRDEERTIRTKGHCPHRADVSIQDAETGSLANIPQANGLVHPTRGKERTIRAKSDRSHPLVMALQDSEASSTALSPDSPQFHASIIATASQEPAIRAERERPGTPSMSSDCHERFSSHI